MTDEQRANLAANMSKRNLELRGIPDLINFIRPNEFISYKSENRDIALYSVYKQRRLIYLHKKANVKEAGGGSEEDVLFNIWKSTSNDLHNLICRL